MEKIKEDWKVAISIESKQRSQMMAMEAIEWEKEMNRTSTVINSRHELSRKQIRDRNH